MFLLAWHSMRQVQENLIWTTAKVLCCLIWRIEKDDLNTYSHILYVKKKNGVYPTDVKEYFDTEILFHHGENVANGIYSGSASCSLSFSISAQSSSENS